MTVLIPAINGQVAARIAVLLTDAGVPVRGLARDQGRAVAALGPAADDVDLRVGPWEDEGVLTDAFEGVEVAFLSIGTDPRQTDIERAFITAARNAGLPHLVKLSTIDVAPDSPNPVGRWHATVEDDLRRSGIPHTLLRPAYFTTNLLRTAAPFVAATGSWRGTSPDGRIAMIDPADVAAVGALVLRDPESHETTYELTGPEAVTLPEIARRLTTLLGRTVTYLAATEQQMHEGMAQRGVPDYYAEVALGIDRSVQAGGHERVTDQVEQLLSRPPRPPEAVLADALPHFQAPTGLAPFS